MTLWNIFLRRLRREYPLSRATARGRRGRRDAERFRPSVLALEDRTVPAGADLFADATLLSGTLVTDTGTNVGASAEPGELPATPTSAPVHSVWWMWTAPASGTVEVNTLGSELDTVLAVRTGTSVDALTVVGVNDDFYDSQSRVLFEAVAGTTYHISVDGFEGQTGAIVLNLATAPANDDFADAVVVTAGAYTGNNTGATAEPGEPSGAGVSAPVNSVWWKWTAQESGQAEFNTFGSELDTLLAVYVGDGLGALQLVATNDDAAGGLQSQVLFDAVEGTTYYVAVDGSLQFTGGIVLNRPENAGGVNRPPVIDDQAFPLDENSVGGTVVGTVAASDPDQNQTLTYSILEGNESGAFSINLGTGEIRVDDGSALNFEANPTFTLLVRVTDSGTPALSDSALVTINLVNLHDAPDFQPAGPFFVAENSAAGTAVGTVTATDVDSGQTVSYSITGGNAGGAFEIDPATGVVSVANPEALDYETTGLFQLTVTATDSDTPPLSSSTTVTVHVENGNEAPVVVDQTFYVPENRPEGALAAAVMATDPDGGQTLTYSIVGGDPAGAFEIDPATGRVTVRDASLLNFEATPSFVLTVHVADSGTPVMSAEAEVTINLIDLNEFATFGGDRSFSVDETVPAGTVVGTAAATDPDGGTTLTYEITAGNAGGAFAIDPATGQITVANPSALDFEARPSFTLTVRATDDGEPVLASSTFVFVTLNDVNDAPVLDATGAMALTPVNQGDFASGGTLVSTLLASAGGLRVSDQDAGAVQGIAVVAADTTSGSWQYSTDGGSTWLALGAVSDASARLLAADALTRVRFVPAAGYNGTVGSGLTFRAWDRTSGANGGLADTALTGGTSAFSTAVETASVKVLSAVEQIALLSADVQTLVHEGALTSSDGNQLVSKLNNARKQLEQGNKTPAENQMNLFINLVSDLVLAGDLDAAAGDDLIAKANAVIVSIWG